MVQCHIRSRLFSCQYLHMWNPVIDGIILENIVFTRMHCTTVAPSKLGSKNEGSVRRCHVIIHVTPGPVKYAHRVAQDRSSPVVNIITILSNSSYTRIYSTPIQSVPVPYTYTYRPPYVDRVPS